VTTPEGDVYSGAEWAAINRWTPPGPPPPGPHGVAALRRTTAGGAVAAAVLVGLRHALEPPASDEVAVVVETDGEIDDPSAAVTLRFDAASPAATVAVVRRPRAELAEGTGTRLRR
jgi:hypothetical protein